METRATVHEDDDPTHEDDDAFPLGSLPEGILGLVVNHLSRAADKKALRSVCRRLRALVDSRVSRLKLSKDDAADLDEMAARWPAVRCLKLPFVAGPALGRATFTSLEDLRFTWMNCGPKRLAPDVIVVLAVAVAGMPKCGCAVASFAATARRRRTGALGEYARTRGGGGAPSGSFASAGGAPLQQQQDRRRRS